MSGKFKFSVIATILLSMLATPAGSSYVLPSGTNQGDGQFGIASTGELKFRAVNPANSSVFQLIWGGLYTPGGEGRLLVSNDFSEPGFPLVFSMTQEDGSDLVDGTYSLEVQAYSSAPADKLILPTNFGVIVSGGEVSSVFPADAPGSLVVADVGGVYNLPMSSANFWLEVNKSDGTRLLEMNGDEFADPVLHEVAHRGHLQEKNGVVWENVRELPSYAVYDEVFNIIDSGIYAKITDPGTYRIEVKPVGVANSGSAYSEEFVVLNPAQTQATQLTTLTLPLPQIRFRVVTPDAPNVALPNASVRVSVEEGTQERSFRTSGSENTGFLSFDSAGTYSIVVETPLSAGDYASKTYSVVVAANLSATIPGLTPDNNGVYTLALSSANFIIRPMLPPGVTDEAPPTKLQYAHVRIFEYANSKQGTFVSFHGMQPGGRIAISLSDGLYFVEVNPGASAGYLITQKAYIVRVAGGDVKSLKALGSDFELASSQEIYELVVGEANTIGRAVSALTVEGTPAVGAGTNWEFGKWVSVDLFFKNGGNWNYVTNTNVDSAGYFSFSLNAIGNYKLTLRPQGHPDLSSKDLLFTHSNLAEVLNIGEVLLPPPDARFAVRTATGIANLAHASVDVLFKSGDKSGQFATGSNTGSTGIAGMTFPGAGIYQVIVRPPGNTQGAERKSYEVVVSESKIVSVTGVTLGGDGVFALALAVSNLQGSVYDPSNTNPIRDSSVVAVDRSTGQELWEQSTQTDNQGRWSMALTQGSYDIYAMAPWGESNFGTSLMVGPVVVGSDGTVSSLPSGYQSSSFSLLLRNPTWSGTVVSPDDPTQLLTNSQVCIVTGEQRQYSCDQTDSSGNWAISEPGGFAGFDDLSALQVFEFGVPEFAELRLEGKNQIEALLGVFVQGGTYTDIQLSPAPPNLVILVTAGGVNASRVWVGVDDGNNWLGGGETNAAGVAKISIPANKLAGELNIQVNISHNNNYNTIFANTYVIETAASAIINAGVRAVTVPLASSNFQVSVRDAGSALVQDAWVEVHNLDTEQWIAGGNTNNLGQTSLSLPSDATYRVTVNPPWNSAANLGKKSYLVVVNQSGLVTSVGSGSTLVTPSGGRYELSLATPSVMGIVRGTDGAPVRDSWVTPMDASGNEYLWWLGANARTAGAFGLNLGDGTFLLEANPAWNSMNSDTRSARCQVVIASSALASTTCAQEGDNVVLDLRPANVNFTLTDGTNPVAFANVSFSYGNWNVWAQSNRLGQVSVNLDGAEIKSKNQSDTGDKDIRISVEPPFGDGSIAGWSCNSGDAKPLCSSILDIDLDNPGNYLAIPMALGVIAFPAPNTTVEVVDKDGSPVGAGNWVVLYRQVTAGYREWIAGASTSTAGIASFNIQDQSGTFAVEVNPSQALGGTYAQQLYTARNFDQVNSEPFALATPNLTVKVFQSDESTKAKWSWVGVEQKLSGSYIWLSGLGTDRLGAVSLSLPANGSFRLTINPGSGSIGARTSCDVITNSAGIVSLDSEGTCVDQISLTAGTLTMHLSQGNVNGTVTGGAAALAGVIIRATANGRESQSTVTKADGSYALSLEAGISWTITAYYVRGAGVQMTSNTAIGTADLTINPGGAVNLTFTISP